MVLTQIVNDRKHSPEIFFNPRVKRNQFIIIICKREINNKICFAKMNNESTLFLKKSAINLTLKLNDFG